MAISTQTHTRLLWFQNCQLTTLSAACCSCCTPGILGVVLVDAAFLMCSRGVKALTAPPFQPEDLVRRVTMRPPRNALRTVML